MAIDLQVAAVIEPGPGGSVASPASRSKLMKEVDQLEKKRQNLEKQFERNPKSKKIKNQLDQVQNQFGSKGKPQASFTRTPTSSKLTLVPAAPAKPLAPKKRLTATKRPQLVADSHGNVRTLARLE